jgi:hypothetical protein
MPMICPICHSDEHVAGFKVLTRGRWWHKCYAGEDVHGDVVYSDGVSEPWPNPVYFADDGTVVSGCGDVRITRQEMT